MEVSGQLYARAALAPRRELPLRSEENAEYEHRAGLNVMERREISCVLPKIEPQFFGVPAQSLVPIATELFRIKFIIIIIIYN
jgi:hypothetical protein